MNVFRLTLFVFLVIGLGLSGGGFVHGAEPKPDMRLVIDISGSMKKTDPENLRIPASKLLLNLAKDGTQFGVWTFGQYVNMLVPHKEVTPAWREEALSQVELINSVALYTNIGEALEKASLNQREPDPEWDRTIVLLSDGMVDISRSDQVNQAEQARIMNELVPRLKKAGFKIHSVALSDDADTQFLRELAVQTNGTFSVAQSADDLMAVFVQASDQVNKPEQVPLEGNRFQIDAAVQEFTALIFRKPGSSPTELFSPDNKPMTVRSKPKNVAWFSDSRYDLITVKNPQPGQWRVKAAIDPDNRVTVVTDLSLVMAGLPDNLIEGERVTMEAWLDENGKVITNRDFLSILDITFSQDASTGERFAGKLSHSKSGKPKVPQDGVYTAKLGRTLTEGEHLFEVSVDGKTFQRKRTQRVTVHRDVLNIEQNFTTGDNGEELKYLIVKPKAALIDPEQINLVAQIKAPNDEKVIQEAVYNDAGDWQIDVPRFADGGVYEVLVKVTGVSANNLPFELIQGPYEVDYTPVGVVAEPLPDLEDMAEAFVEENLEVPPIEEPVVEEEPEPAPPQEPELLVEDATEESRPVVEESLPPEEEEGMGMPLMIALISVVNLGLIAAGWFIYRRTVSKEDEERETVQEEITRLQKQRTEMTRGARQPGAEAAAPAAAVPAAAHHSAPEDTDDSFFADDDDEEEATVINTAPVTEDEKTVAQPAPPPPAPEPEPIPEEENQAYENQAKPLEIDDDEMIEVDDFDDFDEDGIGDLDDMLSEQEEADAEEKKKQEFAEDEFMLDNPEDK